MSRFDDDFVRRSANLALTVLVMLLLLFGLTLLDAAW